MRNILGYNIYNLDELTDIDNINTQLESYSIHKTSVDSTDTDSTDTDSTENTKLTVKFNKPIIFIIENKLIQTEYIDEVLHLNIDISDEIDATDLIEDRIIDIMVDEIDKNNIKSENVTLNQITCDQIITQSINDTKIIDTNGNIVSKAQLKYYDCKSNCNALCIIHEVVYENDTINISVDCELMKILSFDELIKQNI